MPELEEISYSRDATIAAVRDYYNFLAKMYMNEDTIITPPAAGWPSITSADLEGLGKADEVVDLLAHLPYLRDDRDQNLRAHGAPDCYFADWQSLIRALDEGKTDAEELKIVTEGAEFYEEAPPHVVGLSAGADNPLFVLDTELGIVHWSECPGEIKDDPPREPVEDDPYDYAPENEADWRNDAPAWAIADFFELLKDQFRELNFIPISPYTVISAFVERDGRSEGMIPMLQNIFREHGWPDLGRYRKRECLEAVQTALEESYPDRADFRRDQ
ncbi:hypothetical protein F5Y04DRAFT_246250 [Hypomontagnella monticulosa]|nr:hypothetical protein F5Y04DRAFT_246250 [Hypomontagnella monticulosa]